MAIKSYTYLKLVTTIIIHSLTLSDRVFIPCYVDLDWLTVVNGVDPDKVR